MTSLIANARTFLLGIPRMAQKRTVTRGYLVGEGILAENFDGFDYEVTGLNTAWKYEVDNPGSGFKIGPKLTNLYLTHYSAWKVCSYLPDDAFVFLEDDVRFRPGWRSTLNTALAYLPANWDMLYFGSCCTAHHAGRVQLGSSPLWQVEKVQCLHAYAVRAKALPALLEGCAKIYAPIDIAIITEVRSPLRKFAILPRIADQLDTEVPV